MPSQMKLDDLIQERQFSHLEFFRVTINAGAFDFNQSKEPGETLQTAGRLTEPHHFFR